MTRERDIERYLVARIAAEYGPLAVAYKFVSPGHAGVPDRLIVIQRYPKAPSSVSGPLIAFVEVKSPRGSLTENQRRETDRLSSIGANVYVVRTRTDVDLLIDIFDRAGCARP